MPRWIGLLGSWALLVLGLGLGGIAIAAEWINIRDTRQVRNARIIDDEIRARVEQSLGQLRGQTAEKQQAARQIQSEVQTRDAQISELRDTNQVIIVSTEENKVYVRRDGKVIFETICSTGKGTTLVDENGRRMTFNTPTGKFRIISKEKDPVWVPPDWHFIEEAKKHGGRVVRLTPGMALDAYSGRQVSSGRSGIWGWGGGSSGAVLKVKDNNVVVEENGRTRPLPAGEVIRAGSTIVIPPIGTPQRQYKEVLGTHRLNLGDGYALHGTQQVAQLGRSVSHGCVRLKNEDIEHLYGIANVGDEVIIY